MTELRKYSNYLNDKRNKNHTKNDGHMLNKLEGKFTYLFIL